jgi:hypothetical protein
MGPGRSGSKYIHQMLRDMEIETIHESSGSFRGQRHTKLEDCDWVAAGEWITGDRRALCGYPYGFMVHYLRTRVRGLNVICVHRDKASWMISCGAYDPEERVTLETTTSYPEGLSSLEHYWDIYEHLMWSVPDPVLHLEMDDLSDAKPLIEEMMK